MLLLSSLLHARCCRRPYSVMGGLRHSDLRLPGQSDPNAPAAAAKDATGAADDKPAPVKLDKIYRGRIARYAELSRLTEGWNLNVEQKSDMLRALALGVISRHQTGSGSRRLDRMFFRIKELQAYDSAAAEKFGVDLAAARCLLRLGCRVAFEGDGANNWISLFGPDGKKRTEGALLPAVAMPGLRLEAIDARDALVMADSANWMGRLQGLRFLRFKRAPFVDDHLVARLAARCSQLELLDLSACPGVTWEGIASLWRMPSLRRLVLSENPHLLEDPAARRCVPAQLEAHIPGLFVEGVDDLDGIAGERGQPGDPEGVYAA